MRWISYIFMLALASGTACAAENLVCLGGDLEHLTPTERSACQAQADTVRGISSRYSELRGWHFVVVCGDASWRMYSSFAHEQEDYLHDTVADTDRAERVTFLRGTALSLQKTGTIDPRILETFTRLNSETSLARTVRHE